MMRSFFRSLESERVAYLLISGQASVLYGAATFSEDIDLWVAPDRANLRSLLRALSTTGARYHKLTPPVRTELARRGHAFHFTLRASGESTPAYLDVMGRPPRVGRFNAAQGRAQTMTTAWGRVPVVSVNDLVELKLTRRLSDYEVISNLVAIQTRLVAQGAARAKGLARWALSRSFHAEGLLDVLESIPGSRSVAQRLRRPALTALLRRRPDLDRCRRLLAAEIAEFQSADKRYWAGIIDELRQMRGAGELVPEGTSVVAD